MRSGARILVDQLLIHGVDTVYCVPGESYIAALHALGESRDRIRLVTCRHEGGAANMAEAYGKLTGRPGICFVTRGPGATNASIGVHTASQDSTPMILLMGQVDRRHRGREGFQEVDVDRIFDGQAKWAAEAADPERLPELVSRAFHRAVSGRPGPVVLALPEDLLVERCEVEDAGPYRVVQAHPGAAELDAMRSLLESAERPLVLVGGATWTGDASRDMLAFAEANGLPTAAAFRCQDSFDNHHRLYVGEVGLAVNPALARRVREADVLLALGPRLGEATTSGYTLLDVPRPSQRLVHVHAGAEELGRVYQTDVPIVSGLPQFAAAARALPPVDGSRWADWAREARADYLRNIEPQPAPGNVNLSEIVAWLRERLPADAIVANGAGNYTVWAHRFYQFREFRTQLAPTSGAMGYGVPAAVAAKLLHPGRIVICFSGDGDFLMNGQELATAVQYGAAIVVLVVNNGMYGTIRMHQERQFPGHVYGTDLVNPDFVALARAFGAHGELVERTAEFPGAFERALESGIPALLEVRVDPEAITPRATLSEIREQARAAVSPSSDQAEGLTRGQTPGSDPSTWPVGTVASSRRAWRRRRDRARGRAPGPERGRAGPGRAPP